MDNQISPKYLMKLIDNVEKAIWGEFNSYKSVSRYVDKWHEGDGYNWENFSIYTKQTGEIDLSATLHKMDGELLLKIAIDLGVETPDYIPSIPTFKNELKQSFETAFHSFQKACKQVIEHPDIAVGLANSTLESIIKEILKDDRLSTKYEKKKTLYALTGDILREFRLYPDKNHQVPKEIRDIGSALLNISQSIESLRSDSTNLHGKTTDDYIVNDSTLAYFVVNAVSTVGLFITRYYREKFPKKENTDNSFSVDDLPF